MKGIRKEAKKKRCWGKKSFFAEKQPFCYFLKALLPAEMGFLRENDKKSSKMAKKVTQKVIFRAISVKKLLFAKNMLCWITLGLRAILPRDCPPMFISADRTQVWRTDNEKHRSRRVRGRCTIHFGQIQVRNRYRRLIASIFFAIIVPAASLQTVWKSRRKNRPFPYYS